MIYVPTLIVDVYGATFGIYHFFPWIQLENMLQLESQWLGSPPFVSHGKVIWKGGRFPQLGDENDHRGKKTTYKSWDDPQVPLVTPGCPRNLGSMVNQWLLFHLLINGVYEGCDPLILTFY